MEGGATFQLSSIPHWLRGGEWMAETPVKKGALPLGDRMTTFAVASLAAWGVHDWFDPKAVVARAGLGALTLLAVDFMRKGSKAPGEAYMRHVALFEDSDSTKSPG
jgi:hypothetical protein